MRSARAVTLLVAITLVSLWESGSAYAQSSPFKNIQRSLKSVERSINRQTRKLSRNPDAAVVGAIVGGVVGAKIFDDSIVGVAVGVAAGAFIASEISRTMNEDQKRHTTRSTVHTVATGDTSSWSDPASGTKGSVRVVSTEEKPEKVTIPVLKEKVATVPPLDFIGESYRIKANLNVRGGPGTDYEKVGSYPSGSVVNVVGKVKDGPWYFISEDGVGSGFIFADLAEPSGASIVGELPQAPAETETFDVDVAENRLCRTIEQSVTQPDGSTATELMTACKGANGWEIQPAA